MVGRCALPMAGTVGTRPSSRASSPGTHSSSGSGLSFSHNNSHPPRGRRLAAARTGPASRFSVDCPPMNPGELILIIGGGVLLLILTWLIATYNRFVRLRQYLRESWADIDVE